MTTPAHKYFFLVASNGIKTTDHPEIYRFAEMAPDAAGAETAMRDHLRRALNSKGEHTVLAADGQEIHASRIDPSTVHAQARITTADLPAKGALSTVAGGYVMPPIG